MKCSNHQNADATAVCIQCGRALCPNCSTKSKSGRVVCSEKCSTTLLQTEETLQSIRTRHVRSLWASASFLMAGGTVFGVFGLFEVYNGIPRLGFLLVPLAVVFIVCAAVVFWIAKNRDVAG
jgi:predicted nucleic acid-binding Zn ribbon protein